ncbi:MAG: hypothetical protein NVS3B7_14000 [Candidatus Elarobacter sp.]
MSVPNDRPPAPAHRCLNVSCGCNDLVSDGPCAEWCSAHTVEAADVERGRATPQPTCGCGHETCAANRGTRGTPERGMS